MSDLEVAKAVDVELSKVWPRRGWTRGFPSWEQRLAVSALTALKENNEPSRLREKIQERGISLRFSPELNELLSHES